MDHASTTPIDGEVLSVMNNAYKNSYFNPGGLYKEGVATSRIISECRKTVAKLIGTTSEHVIFTRGGTESCNLALSGTLSTIVERVGGVSRPGEDLPHYIISAIEHSAVLETAKNLQKENKIDLTLISVTEDGIVNMEELKKALRPETVLVSIMYVNNEIGTIQPIREIAKLIRWHKKQCSKPSLLERVPREAKGTLTQSDGGCVFHVDAIQATNYLDINVERLGVDLMSLSGSKIYGPKSSGILYARNRNLVSPVLHGGDQEFGLRAGTEDVAQIVGFTKALEIARSISEKESVRLSDLQNYFFTELEKNINEYRINGSHEFRVPNNINISIKGIPSERLVIELDAKGICASSQSACRSELDEESYVIRAIRRNPASNEEGSLGEAGGGGGTEGSIRFTMGRSTTKPDISRVVKELAEIVNEIKAFEAKLTY